MIYQGRGGWRGWDQTSYTKGEVVQVGVKNVEVKAAYGRVWSDTELLRKGYVRVEGGGGGAYRLPKPDPIKDTYSAPL